jgi:hypothetical protein
MRRVDTHSIDVNTGDRTNTDICCPDTSSASRLASNTTPTAALKAAEKVKLEKYMKPGDLAKDGRPLIPIVISPGGLVGELGAAYLRRLARSKAALHASAAPSQAKVVAIYRSFLRRLHFQVIRGMCLQVYLYAMHRDCAISGRPQPTMATVRSRPGVAPTPICSSFLLHAAARPTRSPSVRPRRKAGRR